LTPRLRRDSGNCGVVRTIGTGSESTSFIEYTRPENGGDFTAEEPPGRGVGGESARAA
jgi:hypothetical protein